MDWAAWISTVGVAIRRVWRRRPPVRLVAPLLALAAVLIVAAPGDGPFETARNWVFDSYQRFDVADRSNGRTILIDIDADSLRHYGQWPWPRDRLARLIDRMAGASVLGLDLLLIEPDRASPANWAMERTDLAPEVKQALLGLPGTDETLAASMARLPVVLAAVADRGGTAAPAGGPMPLLEADGIQSLPRYGPIAWPLPILARAATGIGLVSVLPEPDGVLRRMPALAAIADGTLAPSFVVEMLRVAAHADRVEWRATPSGDRELVVGERHIPTDTSGRVWPRYGTGIRMHTIPAWRVLDGEVSPTIFRDRILLIGSSAAGIGDVMATPLHRPETRMLVQANLIDSMLAGDALHRPAAALAMELIAALALGVAATLLIDRLTVRNSTLLLGGLALLLAAGSFLAFRSAGLLLDWVLPVAALVATTLVAFAARIREEVRVRRQYALDLAAALLRAEAADRAKTEFLANASHELRTPLTAILGFSEVMATELFGPLLNTYRDYSRDIHASATHLLSIISDMLDLTVIDMGGRKPADDRIEIGRLVAECERMVLARASDRRVSIVTTVPVSLPSLTADARMVRQMLLNLLSNAIKYSPPDGQVFLTIDMEGGGWLRLSVRDQGPGIAPDDLPNVLQRFARLRSASLAQEPGIGIGLPLTKSMIELHGGRIEIKSELRGGTEVILWFPPARLMSTLETATCEDARQFS
ncbi:MAG TPA: CHASE2 domain-containing protein [Aliidongia sp.]|nr:CHASE2 domain-containing protein [Aliidongia sp.]